MKTIHLLVDPAARSAADPGDGPILHWDAWEVPEGHLSLPALLRDHLTDIRREHAAWAYDMARRDIRGRELQEVLKGGEALSQWWCSLLYERHPKMSPHLYDIYRLRALERLLDAEGADALSVSGADPALRRALERFCRDAGLAFSSRDERPAPPAPSLLRRVYDACPPMLRALARFVHWMATVRRRLPFIGDGPLRDGDGGDTGLIVTYFPNIDVGRAEQGVFRSRYWEELDDLLTQTGGRVRRLFIRFPSPQGDLDQCIRWRDGFRAKGGQGVSFHWLEEFLSAADIRAAWRRHLRVARAAGEAFALLGDEAWRLPGSRLSLKEMFRADWEESFAGWRGLERCLQQRGIAEGIRRIGPQKWYLFPLENCPWERMLTHAAHSLPGAGPVLGAQHSTIRATDFRYFDDPRTFEAPDCLMWQPDRILANGRGARDLWLAAGMPPRRCSVVEALRYLHLAGPHPASDAPTERRLLVATSFFADETRAHASLLARAVLDGLTDGMRVIVKPHPCLSAEPFLREILGARTDELTFADGPVADLLLPGTVVWASNSTTVALEAAMRGLPLLVMRPARDFDLCPLQDVPGLIRTGGLDDVRAALGNGRVPEALNLPADHLLADPALPRWRELLGLDAAGRREGGA